MSVYSKKQLTSSVKNLTVNILNIAGHTVSDKTIQHPLLQYKTAIDNTYKTGVAVFQ